MAKKDKDKKNPAALFIPAGALIGLGIGFIYGGTGIAAGVLIGLGVGSAIMAVLALLKKR